jgi:hypothetical protein
MDNAKKYAEGRGVRLEVRSADDILNVEKIFVIKMKNQWPIQIFRNYLGKYGGPDGN